MKYAITEVCGSGENFHSYLSDFEHSKEECITMLEDLYNNTVGGYATDSYKYYGPEWLNEEHTRLKVYSKDMNGNELIHIYEVNCPRKFLI